MNNFFDAASKQKQAQAEVKKKKIINFKSCFDVIGPVMVGPSSSHTAGAVSIGLAANKLMKHLPKKITIKYYESFAETHKGHGTDYALVGGILGYGTEDTRIPKSLEKAKEMNIEVTFIEMPGTSPVNHPNTACINLINDDEEIHFTGISVGGGAIEIKYIEYKGFIVNPQGSIPILLLRTNDRNIRDLVEEKIKEYNIIINKISLYEKDNMMLYQFDLGTEVLENLRSILRTISKESGSDIIVLI